MTPLAVFDCDEALVNSGPDIYAAMARAFEGEGRAPAGSAAAKAARKSRKGERRSRGG